MPPIVEHQDFFQSTRSHLTEYQMQVILNQQKTNLTSNNYNDEIDSHVTFQMIVLIGFVEI